MARLAIAVVLAFTSPVFSQTWHNSKGVVIASGKGLTEDATSIKVEKTDKTTATIPLDTLSIADRAFLRNRESGSSEFQRKTHQWTSADGKYHVEGKAVFSDDNSLRMARADGKVVTV